MFRVRTQQFRLYLLLNKLTPYARTIIHEKLHVISYIILYHPIPLYPLCNFMLLLLYIRFSFPRTLKILYHQDDFCTTLMLKGGQCLSSEPELKLPFSHLWFLCWLMSDIFHVAGYTPVTSHCYGKSPRVIGKSSIMSIFRSCVELPECTFRLFLPRHRRSPSRLRFRFSSLAERNNFTKCVKVWRNLSSSWVFDRGLLQPIIGIPHLGNSARLVCYG